MFGECFMKRIQEEYKAKLHSPEEAVQAVKNGDWVDYSSNNGFPVLLDRALAARRDELKHVKVRGNLLFGPVQVAECDETMEHFVYQTWHCSSYERRLVNSGRAFFSPMTFRNLAWYYENFLTVDVAMITVSPMDDEGYFNFSCSAGISGEIAAVAKTVILEVNEAMPRLYGEGQKIHISQVDCVVEAGNLPLQGLPNPEPTDDDRKIAANILPYIEDNSVLQLGIGGTPNALGGLISESGIRNLGMHTELCSDGYLALSKAGRLAQSQKLITGLLIGSKELYDWADNNPQLEIHPLSRVNDVSVIASKDKMVSINSCLNVDLFGQISSESSGLRHISGSGGQLDFVTGATMSRRGKAFICTPSTFTDRDGILRSRIVPSFNGDIITTPRSQAYYLVTEQGAVNLAGLSTWERADALISIAHPDFREELISRAQEMKIWLPHNKR